MKKIKTLLVLNEVSGDLQMSNVIGYLQKFYPDTFEFAGVCGDHCKNKGVEVLYDMTHRSAIGIEETIKSFYYYFKSFLVAYRYLKKNDVQLMFFVDSSGFNLPFHSFIRRKKRFNKIKTVYYIPPHITLMGESQINQLRYFDLQLYTFKMDYDLASQYLTNAKFVGHSFAFLKTNYDQKKIKLELGFDSNKILISLFPGSRYLEINYLLGHYFEVVRQLKKDYGDHLELVLALSHKRFLGPIKKLSKKYEVNIKIIFNKADDVLKASDFCLCAAGTATLQAAIYGVPMAVCYIYSSFFYFLSKRGLLKTPFIGMPNILMGEEIVREFINDDCRFENIYPYVRNVLDDIKYRERYLDKVSIIRDKIKIDDQESYGAKLIYELFNNNNEVKD